MATTGGRLASRGFERVIFEMPESKLFDLTWEVLQAAGYCGPVGSELYLRVRFAWVDAGEPADISRFITKQVNDRR